jgi:hypothetical protein
MIKALKPHDRKQTNQYIAGRPSFYFIVLETSVEVYCKVVLKKYIQLTCQILGFQMYFLWNYNIT